jgi:phosphatidylglycerol:prolipoprotein diacylglycerol transferase
MIPVIYKFGADAPWLVYALALVLVFYAGFSGWRSALGPLDTKTGKHAPPTLRDHLERGLLFTAVGLGLAGVGLYYALPEVPLLNLPGKNEGLPVHTYGILVGSGFITAVTLSSWLAMREWPGELGLKRRDQILDLSFYLFLGAIVGSRVLFILVNWKDYAAQPSKIFDLGGGLVFYGGLIGASLASYWYAKKHDIEFLRLADIAMPAVSLGQCLGRLGCFAAGCCWGDAAPKDYAWAVHFPGPGVKNLFGGPGAAESLAYGSQRVDPRFFVESTGQVSSDFIPGAQRISDWVLQHGHSLGVYPTQLFESAGQLVLFVVLLSLRRYRRFHGQIFALWLMSYAVLRSTVELFRGDVERGTLHGLLKGLSPSLAQAVPLEAWYNISTSQFISLTLFGLGAALIWRKLAVVEPLRPLPATAR